MFDALPVAHHLLLGARPGRRRRCGRAGATQVGSANNHAPVLAGQRRPRPTWRPPTLFDALWNRLFADPMLLGRYPDGFARR